MRVFDHLSDDELYTIASESMLMAGHGYSASHDADTKFAREFRSRVEAKLPLSSGEQTLVHSAYLELHDAIVSLSSECVVLRTERDDLRARLARAVELLRAIDGLRQWSWGEVSAFLAEEQESER